ncbi:hypothetical protein RND81_07G194900 [Saponaria officinalis]|uniref:Uncharacterized protein n=1 Tax=Saponaria officinalis TaxID=3572 RepID=A0AAW1JQD6_SAPOF
MQCNSMEKNQEDRFSEIADDLGEKLTLESTSEHVECGEGDDEDDHDVVYVINDDDDDDDDEDEGGEFEFSFAGVEVNSPESAEVLFQNGQIRPTLPFSIENSEDSSEKLGPPVDKVFVVPPSPAAESSGSMSEGPYCVWRTAAESPSPEFRRKSNSTGFSRFWRMKDLLARSNSDGKDRFVFLPSSKAEKHGGGEKEKTMKKMMKVVSLRRIKVGKKHEDESKSSSSSSANGGGDKEEKKKVKKVASMSAAYEALYGKKKGGGGGGGEKSSYLPYRVGFFTNASGMTRNVHPY